jgi:hypothetical protein
VVDVETLDALIAVHRTATKEIAERRVTFPPLRPSVL